MLRKVFFLVFFSITYCQSEEDLEQSAQKFVTNSRQIVIPNYPGALNPSIVPWGDNYLLSFRVRNYKTKNSNEVGLVFLDKNFSVMSTPHVLSLGFPKSTKITVQDPRLINVGNKTYMVFSHYTYKKVYVGEIVLHGDKFSVKNIVALSSFDQYRKGRIEKNWVPFVVDEDLCLSYSISPHIVYKPDLATGHCKTIAETASLPKWKWGEIRGGTPALSHCDEYLAFFHSSVKLESVQSKGQCIKHYFIGAYTFSKEFPFRIKRMSPSPVIGKGFYSGASYKLYKPLKVVFPCGYVKDDEYIYLLYGKQDNEIWVATIEIEGLLDSMQSVRDFL